MGDYTINGKSRKMGIAIVLFALSLVYYFIGLGGVTFDQFAEFLKWTFAIFVATNAVSKFTFDEFSNGKSKKLGGLIVIFVTVNGLLLLGKATYANGTNLMQWSYGIYAVANVGSKAVSTYTKTKAVKE